MERYTMVLDWKNIVKMTLPSKTIYRFNATPLKLPTAFFHRIKTQKFTLVWIHKRSQIKQSYEKRKSWRNQIH